MTNQEKFIKTIGPIATADYQKTGVLASITIAQACLESAYGTSELATKANNYFGMKTNLSGNKWTSAWDGKSIYSKITGEEYIAGVYTKIKADFRKYPSLAKGIEDHSLYLIQAKNGSNFRYAGLQNCKDYKKAAQIIKNGGYATDSAYVSKLCNLITKWNLTQYDILKEKEETALKINQNSNFRTHNTSARSKKIEYLVIHYVGGTGDAKANVNYYNKTSTTSASADFFVGHEGDIWQYNPDPSKRYCWAIGGNKQSSYGGSLYKIATNANSIHIEMCVKNSNGNKTANSSGWYVTDKTVQATVELAKYLMKLYNIPVNKVIRHFDVNGKYCPGVVGWNSPSGSEDKWKSFKKQLESSSSSSSSANSATTKTTSYIVQVTASALNIRSGAGTSYPVVGTIKDKGKYTIVEERNGWGKLKSGAGWISLSYTKRV